MTAPTSAADTTLSEDDFREHQPTFDDALDVNLSEPSPRRGTSEVHGSPNFTTALNNIEVDDDDDDSDEYSGTDSTVDEDALDAEEDMSWRDAAASVTRRVTRLVSTYRLPLAFALVTAAGPRCVNLLDRITSSDIVSKRRRHSGDGAGNSSSAIAIDSTTTSAYPTPPAWMLSARISIPRSVESTVTTILHSFGIPTLGELQQEQLKKQLEEASAAPGGDAALDDAVSDGEVQIGGVPFALLVPIASCVILLTAKLLIARHARRLPSDNVSEDDEPSHSPLLADPSEGRDTLDDAHADVDDAAPLPAVPHLHVSRVERSAVDSGQPNQSLGRNTTRSTASSEPTHGVRTKDLTRSTPRSVILRQNNDALTGSIQKRRLDETPGSNSSPDRQRIPELNERSVETPTGILAMSSHEASPKRSNDSSSLPWTASNVILALTAPATHVEICALVNAGLKYGVNLVIVPATRRDATTAPIHSPTSTMIVEEVEDVVWYCQKLCASRKATSVAVVGRQIDGRSVKLRDIQFPDDEGQQLMYCLDPELIAGDIVTSHTSPVSSFSAKRRSGNNSTQEPLAARVPRSIGWCSAVAHVDQVAHGVAGMANICLLDYSKKMSLLRGEASREE